MSHPGPTLPPPPSDYTTYGAPQYANGQLLDGQNAGQAYPGQYGAFAGQYGAEPQKSFLVTWLFSLLLGVLGVDRFYLGKIGTGIAKLLTLGGLGWWALVDLVITLAGKQTDKNRPAAGRVCTAQEGGCCGHGCLFGGQPGGWCVQRDCCRRFVRQASTPPIVTAAPVTTESARLGSLGGSGGHRGSSCRGRPSAPGGADADGYRRRRQDGGPQGRSRRGDVHVQGLQRQHGPGNQRT